jgi:hypothetical protein
MNCRGRVEAIANVHSRAVATGVLRRFRICFENRTYNSC